MAQTDVILLERVEKLGKMGDVVSVKPGYARNFLLPQNKALRASKENVAYFEAQKKTIAAQYDQNKADAEKLVKKLDGVKVSLIRAASESGQLYGSVTSRDIANEITAQAKVDVDRSMVNLNDNFKMIGLFDVNIVLHPEVIVPVTINIARSPEEAEIQAETGRALVADAQETVEAQASEATEEQLAEVMEEGALEAEVQRQEEEAAKQAEEQAKAEARAAKKAEEEAAKAAAEAEAAEAEVAEAEEASAEEEKAE